MEFREDSPRAEEMIIEADKIRKEIMHNHLDADSPIWFEQSWLVYHKNLSEKIRPGLPVNHIVQGALFHAAKEWLVTEYKLYEGIDDTLKNLKYDKILVTLGHKDIQSHKINNVKIAHHFKNIEIVKKKNVNTFKEIIQRYNLNPLETVMVGDNLQLDIKSSLDAGVLKAFHVIGKNQPYTGDAAFYFKIERYKPIASFNDIMEHLDD